MAVPSRDRALDLIKSGLNPACVLVDLMMPGMTLDDFLREVEPFNLKILLMTGRYDSVATAQLPGICGSLQKPISPDLIVQAVENIIGKDVKVRMKDGAPFVELEPLMTAKLLDTGYVAVVEVCNPPPKTLIHRQRIGSDLGAAVEYRLERVDGIIAIYRRSCERPEQDRRK